MIVLNISWGVAWGASLVRTWRTILSWFLKKIISPMVAPGMSEFLWNFTWPFCTFWDLTEMNPRHLGLFILSKSGSDCCLDFLNSFSFQYPSWNKLVQGSMLHLRHSENYVGALSLIYEIFQWNNTVVYIVDFSIKVCVVIFWSIGVASIVSVSVILIGLKQFGKVIFSLLSPESLLHS